MLRRFELLVFLWGSETWIKYLKLWQQTSCSVTSYRLAVKQIGIQAQLLEPTDRTACLREVFLSCSALLRFLTQALGQMRAILPCAALSIHEVSLSGTSCLHITL